LAVNAERLMPDNYLQLRFEELSSAPNVTRARVIEFLERKANGDGLVLRSKTTQESAHRKHAQVAATRSSIDPEQRVSHHLNERDPDQQALVPTVSTGPASEESIAQGEEAWRRGDFPTAINTLGAVAKSTDSILPKLADALLKKGHYGEALLRFRQALASDETNPELWLGRAQTRLALGQRTEAAADFQRALDLGLVQPVRALKPMMSLDQDILAPIRAALERNPHDIGLLVWAAEMQLAYGSVAEARATTQRLSGLVPDRVDFVTPVAKTLIQHGWFDEARTLLEPLTRNMPGDPEIQRLVGLLAAKANNGSDRTATAAQTADHSRPRSAFSNLPRRALRFGTLMLRKLRSP
jgi:predicted Zn-dependent protease